MNKKSAEALIEQHEDSQHDETIKPVNAAQLALARKVVRGLHPEDEVLTEHPITKGPTTPKERTRVLDLLASGTPAADIISADTNPGNTYTDLPPETPGGVDRTVPSASGAKVSSRLDETSARIAGLPPSLRPNDSTAYSGDPAKMPEPAAPDSTVAGVTVVGGDLNPSLRPGLTQAKNLAAELGPAVKASPKEQKAAAAQAKKDAAAKAKSDKADAAAAAKAAKKK